MRVTNPKQRGILFAAAIGLLALVVSPAPVQASTLPFNLNFVFSGNVPDSTSPFAIATFRDGGDCLGGACGANTVQLVLTSSLEDPDEFITEWDFNSSVLPLTIVYATGNAANSGSYSTTGVIQPASSDAYKADGDGLYDISFQFASGPPADRFNGTDVAVFTITGTGITVGSFNVLATPDGGAGPFHTAAHVQGITPNCSGWVSDTVTGSPGSNNGPCVPAPEPSTLLLLGSGLASLGLLARRKFMSR